MKFAHGKLVALQSSISNGALKGDELPTQLKLLGWGLNQTVKGPVHVTTTTLSALSANQAKYGFDRIALDFEHNSVPGHPNFKPAPREIAAYGVPRVIEGDGLYLEEIEWTPSGQQYARNFSDLSPTPLLNEKQEVEFLHSVALCEHGAVEGLRFYNAEPTSDDGNLSMKTLAQLLIAILGLPEDSPEEQIQEAGKAYLEKLATAPEPEDKKTAGAPPDAVTALTARLDQMERTSLLALAASEGKVIPASCRDLPVANLKALVAELPATVPMDRRTAAGLKPLTTDAPMSDTDKAVAAQLGISEADWAKRK